MTQEIYTKDIHCCDIHVQQRTAIFVVELKDLWPLADVVQAPLGRADSFLAAVQCQ